MRVPGEVKAQLGEIVARFTSVIGPDLVGVHPAGSFALDAFEAGRSDSDVAVVARGPALGA